MEVMKQAKDAYEIYELERWVLTKEKGKSGLGLSRWESGDVGWPGHHLRLVVGGPHRVILSVRLDCIIVTRFHAPSISHEHIEPCGPSGRPIDEINGMHRSAPAKSRAQRVQLDQSVYAQVFSEATTRLGGML